MKKKTTFSPNFNIYTNMAYFVSEQLNLRPNTILDEWGVPELIVAYGYYANQISQKNYAEWAALDAKTRASKEKPTEYIVKFYSPERLQDG